MEKVENLLSGMSKSATTIAAEKLDAYDSAAQYLEGLGYRTEYVTSERLHGRQIVVVGRTLPMFTTDVPFGLEFLRPGVYFVKKDFTGGISEILAGGHKHDFLLAKWNSLR